MSSSPLSSSSRRRRRPTDLLSHGSTTACRRRRPSDLLSLGSTTACRVKLTESFDAHLHLDDEQREALFALLSAPEFCARVSLEATRATKQVEFDKKVFVPVPWSPATKRGMPLEYEVYAQDRDNYVVINVPAPITFKANILGKRCCAIYRIVGEAK